MLSCYDGFDFVVSPNQLNGIYNIRGYRKFLLTFVNRKADVSVLREFDEAVAKLDTDEDASFLSAWYRFACQGIIRDFTELFDGSISTAEPRSWALLHDMIVNATSLCTRPMYVYEAPAHEYIWCVAACVDIMTRLSDVSLRATAPLDFENPIEIRKRASVIFADFLVGRSCAWLSLVDDLLVQACVPFGLDWEEVLDDVFADRLNAYDKLMQSVADIVSPGSSVDAYSLFIYQTTQCAALWDFLQQHTFSLTFGEIEVDADTRITNQVFYMDIVNQLGDDLTRSRYVSDNMTCYSRMFNVCAPLCVAPVMSNMTDVVISTYNSYMEAN